MVYCRNTNALWRMETPGPRTRTIGSASVGPEVDRRQGLLAQFLGVHLEAPDPVANLRATRLVLDALEIDPDAEDRSAQAGVGQERGGPHVADRVDVSLGRQFGRHAHQGGAG